MPIQHSMAAATVPRIAANNAMGVPEPKVSDETTKNEGDSALFFNMADMPDLLAVNEPERPKDALELLHVLGEHQGKAVKTLDDFHTYHAIRRPPI